jgi:hypothetical protein
VSASSAYIGVMMDAPFLDRRALEAHPFQHVL